MTGNCKVLPKLDYALLENNLIRMSLTVDQTSAAALANIPSAESSEQTFLDAASRAKLVRLALQSLLFVLACVAIKLPFTAVLVFAYFVFIEVRYRLETPDLLALWLVAAPFLGHTS